MDKKLFIGLFLSFFGATIIGTLSHEFGHYIVAKYLGYGAKINYGATFLSSHDQNKPLTAISEIAVTLGGPIITMLTGTIGIVLLIVFRKNFYCANKLSRKEWLIVFFSLFWLRQPANFSAWLGSYIINGAFSSHGDEIRIASYFGLPIWTIISATASIGALTLAMITFKFIPTKQRLTFLTAGLTGGIAGYIFWLELFGRYIMP